VSWIPQCSSRGSGNCTCSDWQEKHPGTETVEGICIEFLVKESRADESAEKKRKKANSRRGLRTKF
jgi:hypothetical protein